MPPIELITTEQWDAKIKQHSLHLKHDSQLFFLEENIENKIPRIAQDLFEHGMFPDAIKRDIYFGLVESGEITPEPLDATKLSLANQTIMDSEYLSGVAFYRDKKAWLEDKLTCCKKEMELRADELVVRKPLGTEYFIDFNNGHDVNNDGSTAVKSNGDGPVATLDKYTSIAVAGDVAHVRRGMTQAVSADLAFANDGTIVAPITLEADFDDDWGDEAVAGETATLIFGSKTVTFAGDISGDIAAGDWIYESTEDNREFAYEVASVTGGSNEIVTLLLPYKGAISGAGKTINIMPDNPIWNTAAGNFEVNLDGDNYWKFQGLHLRGTDFNGVVEIDGCIGHVFKDCILEGNGSADIALRFTDEEGVAYLKKCRTYNCGNGIYHSQTIGSSIVKTEDCLFDGNNTANSLALRNLTAGPWFIFETEMRNHALGDITALSTSGAVKYYCRNCLFSSATEIDAHDTQQFFEGYSEDHDGTVGDNRQLTGFSVAEATPSIQSEDTEVRVGGGTTSIKVTPSDKLATAWEMSKILLFEYPIYAVKDVAKTYTVYFSSDDDTDWDADPLNTELWVEAEYWGHATNIARKILKSTGVCNNFDADDTVWDSLAVTVTPLQTGVLYLRGYYCKTKEAGNSNIFYCDTKVVIS